MSKATDIAWAAGIIDGEGCINLIKMKAEHREKAKNDYYDIRIAVEIREKEVCLQLLKLFGGRISFQNRNKKNPKHSNTYKWSVSTLKAIEAVKELLPYLVVKSKQARLIVEYSNLPKVQGKKNGIPIELQHKREAIYLEMKILNKRGISNVS